MTPTSSPSPSNPARDAAAAAGMTTGLSLLLQKLSEPFAAQDVKFKPQAVRGNRALAIAYIDVRAVMDRLDSVVGPDGWEDEYTIVGDGSVVCRLSIGGVAKSDVGSPSEQPDGGDRLKAAFSDALKRTAIKFGIGRYLYRLPHQWCDYDVQKKAFVHPPQLPAWAQPNGSGRAPAGSHGETVPPNGKGPGPSVALMTLGHVATINAKLAQLGRGPAALLAHFKVKRLEDVPDRHFADIIAAADRQIAELQQNSDESGDVPY